MTSLKESLRAGKDPLAGFLNLIPSVVATQALAAAGADVVVIDQEHGPIGPETLHAMIASTAGTPCSPWVRVPRHDEAFTKTALDAGAEGILFPLISTAESAAECVALTRYPPQGRRGWGPFVAHSRWGVNLFDYLGQRGGETVCGILIETRSAIDNIREICKVEGVDCMTIALSIYQLTLESRDALTKEQTQALLKKGYRLLWHHFDVLILKQFVRQTAEWRSA